MPDRFHPRIIRVNSPAVCPYLKMDLGHHHFCESLNDKIDIYFCQEFCDLEIDKGKIVIRSCETCVNFKSNCWGARAMESDGLACWKNKNKIS